MTVADDAFAEQLNDLLVSTFHSIERYEERSLRAFDGLDLSVNEAHVIEAVGHGAPDYRRGVTVTNIADALDVRAPTATSAVNRLVKKGLLAKERNAQDGRAINVRLTREGRRAFRLHELFHRRMVDAIAGSMTPAERVTLVQGIQKLKAFFSAETDAGGAPVAESVVVCRTANDAATSAAVGQNGTPTLLNADAGTAARRDSTHDERED